MAARTEKLTFFSLPPHLPNRPHSCRVVRVHPTSPWPGDPSVLPTLILDCNSLPPVFAVVDVLLREGHPAHLHAFGKEDGPLAVEKLELPGVVGEACRGVIGQVVLSSDFRGHRCAAARRPVRTPLRALGRTVRGRCEVRPQPGFRLRCPLALPPLPFGIFQKCPCSRPFGGFCPPFPGIPWAHLGGSLPTGL